MHFKSIALAIAAAVISTAATAQSEWPSEPIRAIVPFPAGGQADIVTRVVAEPISQILGQPILVEARPGAGGNVGTEEVVKAEADGHTWLHTGVPLTTAPAIYPTSLGFDPMTDLQPVIRFGSTSFVIAVPSELPVNTVEELVAYAKERPGDLSYAGSGIGSLVHLVSELFKLEAGIDVAMIPYNGQPPAIADLLANRVQFMVLGLSLAQPLVEAGQLKALAVLDEERHANMPDVPSIVEAGYPGLVASGWAGIHVPAGTPDEIVDEINAAVTEVITDPEIAEEVTRIGWKIVPPQSPEEFAAFIEAEVERWAGVVEAANVETN